VHCNLRLVDSIEEFGRSDASIDWSSDDEEDWLTDIKAAFEILRTLFLLGLFFNFILNGLNFTTMTSSNLPLLPCISGYTEEYML